MPDRVYLDTQTGYDQWSTIYDTEGNPLLILEEPVVRQWVGDPSGLRVADVGCGTGRHTVWLAQAGASVDAYDFSKGMMAKALKKLGGSEVRFHEHDLTRPLPAADEMFDLTMFALVADHIKDLDAAFRELHRITKPGGQVIFSVLHPAMNLIGITARFINPESGEEVRVEAYEHTYGEYVIAVLRSGLRIVEIVERHVDDPLVVQSPRAEKYMGWPLLLAMNLRKKV
jgi:ubiquinone/menaquinone biosynthesis C-methylase UbiE